MPDLVAEIAERVKQPHNPAMRKLGSMLLVVLGVGCGPAPMPADGPVGYAGPDARAFVQKHRAELEAEIGVGSGQTIYDLAILANCQDVPQLSRRLHRRQPQLFAPEGNPEGGNVRVDAQHGTGQRSDAVVGNPVGGGVPAGGAPAAEASDAVVAERIVRFMEESREFRCQGLDRTRTRQFAAGTRHVGPRRGATTARGGTP